MSRKHLQLWTLSIVLTVLALGAPAWAMRIDPSLTEALAGKEAGTRVQVLVIYDGDFRLAGDVLTGDVLTDADGAPGDKRRDKVLAALKKRMHKAQGSASAVLDDPDLRDQVANIHVLYLAGAISFEGTAAVVNRLAALPDDAVLFHDNARATYDASHPAAVDGAKLLPASTDTAWGVKYIKANQVWNQLGFTGTGVIVGHIDTGVWLAHPDLAPGIWNNPGEIVGNGIDDDGNGFIDDWRGWDFGDNDNNPDDNSPTGGHGTHTAGTVIGRGVGCDADRRGARRQADSRQGLERGRQRRHAGHGLGRRAVLRRERRACHHHVAGFCGRDPDGLHAGRTRQRHQPARCRRPALQLGGQRPRRSEPAPERDRLDRARARAVERPGRAVLEHRRRVDRGRYRLQEQSRVRQFVARTGQVGRRRSLQRLAVPAGRRPDQAGHLRPGRGRQLDRDRRRLQRRHLERHLDVLPARRRRGGADAAEEPVAVAGRHRLGHGD